MTKKNISNGLFFIAILLLLTSIFQKGAEIENRTLDIAAYAMLFVAAVYHFGILGKDGRGKDTGGENKS